MTTVGPWERERLLKNIWGKKQKQEHHILSHHMAIRLPQGAQDTSFTSQRRE